MTKFFLRSLVPVLCVSAFVGCTSNKDKNSSGVSVLDATAIVRDKSLTPKDKAEKLALAGERLFTSNSFMFAETIFQQALAQDSTNLRAQFYTAFLAGPMEMKGILTRIQPLAYSTDRTRAEYDKYLAKISPGGLRDFLLDGSPDIKTEDDLQAFGDELFESQDTFRTFLKEHKDLKLTLHANEWLASVFRNREILDCLIKQSSYENKFEFHKCSDVMIDFQINRADVETLEQMAAGVQISSILSLAYNATGTVATYGKFGAKAKHAAVWKDVVRNSNFGKVRASADAMKRIIPMGVDGIAGIRWAAAIQDEICPKGKTVTDSRPGFLFGSGICVNAEEQDGSKLQDILKTVETALSGQLVALRLVFTPTWGESQWIQNGQGEWQRILDPDKIAAVPSQNQLQMQLQGHEGEINTDVKPIALLLNPIQDLKSLRPVFNNCDKLHSISDDSLGGVFVNNDANEVLAAKSLCRRPR